MRKKIILPIVILLLLAVGAFCAFLIYDAFNPDEKPTGEQIDIATQIRTNRDTAFSFFSESENILPDNMRGYIVDFSADIDFSADESSVTASAERIFEKVDAIQPNTVVIKCSQNVNYTVGASDILRYFIETAKAEGFFTVVYFTDAEADKDKLAESAVSCSADAVMTDSSILSAEKTAEICKYLNSKDIRFGIYTQNAPEKTVADILPCCDFCFVQINNSTENGADTVIRQWAETGLKTDTKIYGIIRNDLVKSGVGWTKSNEVNSLVKLIYNYGGFSGCVMYSHGNLASNDNDTATNLYSYYEYFNNVDYTALTYTDVKLGDGEITFSGTSDKNFPVFVSSTASGCKQATETQGDEGNFTVSVPLVYGENKITVSHKNALYTYNIDRAVDVMTDCTAKVENGVVTLSATAIEGAQVFASLANTVPVKLTAAQAAGNGYMTYTASYTLTDWLQSLTDQQVSFGAEFNGLEDIVMCGETKPVTPYDDHGLGRADICRVEKNYAETTSTASLDDTSDPTCTPQLTGSYGYVDKVTVCDNHVLLYLTSGMKLHCADTRFIVDGYRMPENTVTTEATDCTDGTTITFSQTYSTFIKMVLAPQTYYKGYLDRIYNVQDFESEYIDILFMDTDYCMQIAEPDFSASDVISKAEWYGNEEDNFMLMRLYLREKGNFAGYEYSKTDDGKVILTLKKKPSTLDGAVIMIDPGHGGYGSPGTSSESGIYEEDVVFAVSQRVAEILEGYGATVIVTRQPDEAVFLGERVEMIRENSPDVFLSIHADGADNKSWFGTHTFYYRNYSMPLADAIHNRLVSAYRSSYYTDTSSPEYENVDMGVKFFPYMVTRVEECPSVLVECGYLTNLSDAAFLTDSTGQDILARAIAQGVSDYLAG